MEFKVFKEAIQQKMDRMYDKHPVLFIVDINKDEIWEHYLNSFPEGTNNIFQERREYDCNCCKQFIRPAAGIVAIDPITYKLESIWDIEVPGYYQDVADAMSKYVKSLPIKNVFLHDENKLGNCESNVAQLSNGETQRFHHFFKKLPQQQLNLQRCHSIYHKMAEYMSNFNVMKRGLLELERSAFEMVLDVIASNSIYRGEEFKESVLKFEETKRHFDSVKEIVNIDNYIWLESVKNPNIAKFRNTVIGTLIVDLSDGKDLEEAVASYESKVAPQNYKRTKKVVTRGMIKQAEEKVLELGLMESLPRRFATLDDIKVNDTIFINRQKSIGIVGGKQSVASVFDKLKEKTTNKIVSAKDFDKVETLSIEKFIRDVVPNADEIEILVENNMKNNFVSLIAPVNNEAPSLFKWKNGFSWTYEGNLTDSLMKERVKSFGGKVDGVLRFSIQWNEDGNNNDDLDAHCKDEVESLHIYYGRKKSERMKGGLDVDIIDPSRLNGPAVENIVFEDLNAIKGRKLEFYVNRYSNMGGRGGFRAEIEFNGQIFTYNCDTYGHNKYVATVEIDRKGNFHIEHKIPAQEISQDVYGIKTQDFQKVNILLYSPNHWEEEEIKSGNKHYFFMLQNCVNPGSPRGFFNEFLRPDLNGVRKTFEVLGNEMKAEKQLDPNKQLSGLGFSSTISKELTIRVSNDNLKRVFKVKI